MKQAIKIIAFFTVCLVLSCSLLFAQNAVQGIYLSGNDFNNNKISFTPIQGKKYKIHLDELLEQPAIKIITSDSTITLNKDAVFGYRDNENTIHRFYKKIDYKVLNPAETILIYTRTLLGGYHNSQTIVQYYFSAGANEVVLPLTKWDIKNAFPDDSSFHELLDMYFHSDNELMSYDSFSRMYKLNRVFQLSRQIILKNNNHITGK